MLPPLLPERYSNSTQSAINSVVYQTAKEKGVVLKHHLYVAEMVINLLAFRKVVKTLDG